MIGMPSGRCKLCGRETSHMAHSHILPVGFIPKDRTGSRKLISVFANGSKHRRPKGVADDKILCDNCEHQIITPYDQYAIDILRDKHGAERGFFCDSQALFLFHDVDRRRIRGFFASLLWRMSVSSIGDCSHVDIGNIFTNRIAADLLSAGQFNYIDAIVYAVRGSIIGNGFLLPAKARLNNGRGEHLNGYRTKFSGLDVTIALDSRPNYLFQTALQIGQANNANQIGALSISAACNGRCLCVPEIEEDEGDKNEILSIMASYKANGGVFVRMRRGV